MLLESLEHEDMFNFTANSSPTVLQNKFQLLNISVIEKEGEGK